MADGMQNVTATGEIAKAICEVMRAGELVEFAETVLAAEPKR